MGVSARLKLATRRDIERRVQDLLNFYKREYGYAVFAGERSYHVKNLLFTQSFVESDKLGLVLRSVLFEGYRVPIIVVIGDSGQAYVVDGHHRTIVYAWLGWRVPGLTIIAPKYRSKLVKTILDIDTINPPDTPSELACWRHLVNTIRFLEKEHSRLARLWLENIEVSKLKPTEPPIISPSPHPTSLTCPILVYKRGEEYYVVDGHHRVCTKLLGGERTVQSIVFTIEDREIGIIKTSKRIGYELFTIDYCRSSS